MLFYSRDVFLMQTHASIYVAPMWNRLDFGLSYCVKFYNLVLNEDMVGYFLFILGPNFAFSFKGLCPREIKLGLRCLKTQLLRHID